MSKLGEQIINFLKDYTTSPLPDYGILAGQSVAEAYFNIKKIPIQTRIKDLDLFINLQNQKLRKKYSAFTRDYSNEHLLQKKHCSVAISTQRSSFAEELIESTIQKNNHYQIVDVFSIDTINIVETKFNSTRPADHLEAVVESFDINAIKIGVCLKTKKVYLSYDFKQFIVSKQVQIKNLNTPVKSLCRFLEKSEYYKGAFFDFHYEVNLVLPYFLLNDYKNNPKIKSTKIIKDSYERLSVQSKKRLQKYFIVENSVFEKLSVLNIPLYESISTKELSNFMKKMFFNNENVFIITPKINYFAPRLAGLANIIKSEDVIYSKELDEIHQYSEQKLDNSITKKMRNFIMSSKDEKQIDKCTILTSKEIEVVSFRPKIRKFNKTIKDNLKHILASKRRKADILNFVSDRQFLTMLYSGKKSNLFFTDMKQLITKQYIALIEYCLYYQVDYIGFFQIKNNLKKALLRHMKLIKFFLEYHSLRNPHEGFDFMKLGIKLLEIEKSDYPYIIGYVETKKLPLDFIYKTKEEIHKFIKRKETDENSNINKLPAESLQYKDYKINHVSNTFYLRRIGSEMKHCVGGYSSKLINLEMLFFDVYDKKNKRYTLSVHLKRDKEKIHLHVDQLAMKMNVLPARHIKKDMIDFVGVLEENVQGHF